MAEDTAPPADDDGGHARFAVILTHNRPRLLEQAVRSVAGQVDIVLVLDNASDPPAVAPEDLDNVVVCQDPTQPPNLAALWNRALDAVEKCRLDSDDTWDVAMLCDDVAVPPGWFDTVSEQMRAHGAAAASTHPYEALTTAVVKTTTDSDYRNRLCGWAFILRGETRLRADESMHWWWNDVDVDRQARMAGGIVLAAGPVVANQRPNDFTHSVPGLAERAGLDRQAFVAKWGDNPW